MTIVPRWIQYSFVAAAIAGVGVVLVMHDALSFNVGDLLRIRTDEISLLAVRPDTSVPAVPVARGEWPQIRKALAEDNHGFPGAMAYKGWIPVCSLSISVKGHSFPYLLELETRSRAKGQVLLSLERGSVESTWQYGYYAGGAVLGALRKIAPDKCGGWRSVTAHRRYAAKTAPDRGIKAAPRPTSASWPRNTAPHVGASIAGSLNNLPWGSA